MKKLPQTISLTLIVKNEEIHLPTVLETARIYADEIVIVDTGSTDKTKDIARIFTNKIFDFEWCDDFSKARNFGIEKCTGDFIIWLDADDLVTKETANALLKLKQTPIEWDVLYLPYIYARDAQGKATHSQTRERIFRNHKQIKFHFPIHECLSYPQGLKYEYNYDINIIHNKIASNEPSTTRNLRILSKAVETEEYSKNLRVWSLLARESEPHKAISYYTHIIEHLFKDAERSYKSQTAAHFATKLIAVKDYERALEMAGKAIVLCPVWREPYFYAAQAYYNLQLYSNALQMLKIAGTIPPPPANLHLMHDMSIYDGDVYYEWLFFTYHYLWDRDNALAVLEKVLKDNPNSPTFLRLKSEKHDWLYPKK